MLEEAIKYIDTMLWLLKREKKVREIQLEQDLITPEEKVVFEIGRKNQMLLLSNIREILVKREPLTKGEYEK